MKRNLTIWLALALAIFALPAYQSALLAAPQSQSATATPIAEEEPAATPEPAEEPAEAADDYDHNDEVNSAAEAPTLEELAARVSALEAQLADRGASDANTVATALYLLDNVGLHDLDTRLNEAGTIEAGDAGTVARINRVLSTILWPSDLAADATTLMDTLTQLNAALSDDDLTTAA
ncbi:MAG: hypothetical protein KDE19_09005, partial [Caldilineaceae bacterium]|nr:hypothetical protein [Caldilineaceae bacterium]